MIVMREIIKHSVLYINICIYCSKFTGKMETSNEEGSCSSQVSNSARATFTIYGILFSWLIKLRLINIILENGLRNKWNIAFIPVEAY